MDIDSRFLSKKYQNAKKTQLLSPSPYKTVDLGVKKGHHAARCPSADKWAKPPKKLTFLSPSTELGKSRIKTRDFYLKYTEMFKIR